MKLYQFEVNRGQLKAAHRCVLQAANTAYNRRDEIDFYCPEETQFMACIAAMLQRFRHQLKDDGTFETWSESDEEIEGEDCLEFNDRERQTLLEVFTIEIEINVDAITKNPDCPETLRELAYQWELFDMVYDINVPDYYHTPDSEDL